MFKLNTLNTSILSPPFHLPHFHTSISLPRRKTTITLTNSHSPRPLRHFTLFHPRQTPSLKVIRASSQDYRILEADEAELLLATCITRTLPPALTLEHGLDEIKEAVEEFKLNPPASTTGMYRFQVAVSPGAKALNWFCCQPESSGVFPQFFLSDEIENPSCKSLSLSRARGVFGVGAAFYFKGSYPCATVEDNSFKRYLSVDSTLVMAYGFVDISSYTMSSTMKCENGSFHLFIPQIELVEFEGISILAATLAWNGSSPCAFEESVQTYELSLYQVS